MSDKQNPESVTRLVQAQLDEITKIVDPLLLKKKETQVLVEEDYKNLIRVLENFVLWIKEEKEKIGEGALKDVVPASFATLSLSIRPLILHDRSTGNIPENIKRIKKLAEAINKWKLDKVDIKVKEEKKEEQEEEKEEEKEEEEKKVEEEKEEEEEQQSQLPMSVHPTVSIETGSPVGFFPYLNHKSKHESFEVKISVEIPEITQQEFLSMINVVKDEINKYTKEQETELELSYGEVYSQAKIVKENENTFKFLVKGGEEFQVNFEEKKGISIKFSDKTPSAQSIAAAAGFLSEVVKAQDKKPKKVKGLVIRDYAVDPLSSFSVYCSLACQDKPVRFAGEGKSFSDEDQKLMKFLQNLSNSPEGKVKLMKMVEEEHTTLNALRDKIKDPNYKEVDLLSILENGMKKSEKPKL
eukprot:TRINITY_DN1825_c0_g1_i1.p1 TRINITY_DN1825_c0_g1~~TRINITY_DN1825_c0_g1_i1.p1  ORF type:complete len:412 (-),score=14.61 TRINITY_DN1825_c0_g1_i1:72-1307(-)